MIKLDIKKLSKWLMICLLLSSAMMFITVLDSLKYNDPKNIGFVISFYIIMVIFVLPTVLSILLFLEIDSKKIKGLKKIEKQIRNIKTEMGMVYGVPLLLELFLLILLIMIFGISITVYTSIFQLMAITTALIKVYRPLEDKLASSRKFKSYLKIFNDSIYPNLNNLYDAFKNEDSSTIRNLKHSIEPIYLWMMEKISNELYAGNKFVVNSNHDNYGEFVIKKIDKEKGNINYVLKSNDEKNAKSKGVLSEFLEILKKEIENYKQFHDNENNLPFTEIELRNWRLI